MQFSFLINQDTDWFLEGGVCALLTIKAQVNVVVGGKKAISVPLISLCALKGNKTTRDKKQVKRQKNITLENDLIVPQCSFFPGVKTSENLKSVL